MFCVAQWPCFCLAVSWSQSTVPWHGILGGHLYPKVNKLACLWASDQLVITRRSGCECQTSSGYQRLAFLFLLSLEILPGDTQEFVNLLKPYLGQRRFWGVRFHIRSLFLNSFIFLGSFYSDGGTRGWVCVEALRWCLTSKWSDSGETLFLLFAGMILCYLMPLSCSRSQAGKWGALSLNFYLLLSCPSATLEPRRVFILFSL